MVEILRPPNLLLFDYIQEYVYIKIFKIIESNTSHMKEYFKLHIFLNNCYLSRVIHIIFCSHLLSSNYILLITYLHTFLNIFIPIFGGLHICVTYRWVAFSSGYKMQMLFSEKRIGHMTKNVNY